jgi:hypothetical protein
MLGFILGIVIGLIVGWNLLPQPAVVKRLYDRAYVRIMRWIMSMSLIAACCSIAGCSGIPGVTEKTKPYPWKQRFVAEIALASLQTSPTPAPDDVKVGDRCPDCNDPPGDCGVGKTGDSQICDRCKRCQGDGRIDDADLRSDGSEPAEDLGESVVETQKEIVLHVTRSTQKAWANDWYNHKRQAFEDAGWFVRFILEPDNSIKTAYFDVVAPDGKVENFFEPLTLEMLEQLEIR